MRPCYTSQINISCGNDLVLIIHLSASVLSSKKSFLFKLPTFDDSPKCLTKASLRRFLNKIRREQLFNICVFVFLSPAEGVVCKVLYRIVQSAVTLSGFRPKTPRQGIQTLPVQ